MFLTRLLHGNRRNIRYNANMTTTEQELAKALETIVLAWQAGDWLGPAIDNAAIILANLPRDLTKFLEDSREGMPVED